MALSSIEGSDATALRVDYGDNGDRLPAYLLAWAIAAALLTGIVTGCFGGLIAIVAVAVLLFMGAAINDYRAGILIAMVLLPLSSSQLMPREMFGIIGFNPFNATLLMSIIALLFMRLLNRASVAIPAYPRYFWIYSGMLVVAAFQGSFHVSAIPAVYRTLHLINFDSAVGYVRDTFLKPELIVLTAMILSVAVRNAKQPARYLIPLFLSALVMPIVVIVYIATSGVSLGTLASSHERGFLSDLGMHANQMGFLFNTGFALGLFTLPAVRSIWIRGALLGAVVVLGAAVMLTFSRGAFLGILAVLVYFFYTRGKLSILMIGLLLIPAAIFLMPEAVIERASLGMESGDIDTISAGRVDHIWLPLIPDVMSSPLTGHGLHAIMWSEATRHGEILPVEHPHNAYLGALLDVGVIGSVVILLFFVHMWRLYRKLVREAVDPVWRGFFTGANACILLFMVQGFTDDRFTPTFPQSFIWLSYGIAIGIAGRADGLLARPDTGEDR